MNKLSSQTAITQDKDPGAFNLNPSYCTRLNQHLRSALPRISLGKFFYLAEVLQIKILMPLALNHTYVFCVTSKMQM